MLGQLGVGAGDEDAPAGVLSPRRPHLLAVDDPLVAIAVGLALQPGEVGSGDGLAEELATDDVAAVQIAKVGVLHLIGGVGQDRRRHHAEADAERSL